MIFFTLAVIESAIWCQENWINLWLGALSLVLVWILSHPGKPGGWAHVCLQFLKNVDNTYQDSQKLAIFAKLHPLPNLSLVDIVCIWARPVCICEWGHLQGTTSVCMHSVTSRPIACVLITWHITLKLTPKLSPWFSTLILSTGIGKW